MGPNRLYPGDCIEGMARLEEGSVDLAFADPPFNIGYEYDVYDDRSDEDRYLEWTRAWGRAVCRVLKPTGTFWLAIGDEYAAELKLIFQRELGLTCRSWVIWYYTFGVNCKKKFSRSHAHLFHFVKNPRDYTFNFADMGVRVPSARQLVYNDSRAETSGRLPDDTWILRPHDLPDGFKPDEDTWFFSRVCGTFRERAGWHGCQMPEQLLGRIVRVSSHANDLVLDPFSGSGTTLVAAKKLGRRWVGFELSPNYAAQAQARLDGTTEGQALDGVEDAKASAPPTPLGRRHLGPTERGVIKAFLATRDGYPADRVVADPVMNLRFVRACRDLRLTGEARDWNRTLFKLRKSSRLKGLPRARRTELTVEDVDRYGFACEIGLQHFRERELNLDGVLCDPEEAAAFDQFVAAMIPEPVDPFKIRWIAMHLRKRAKDVRRWGREANADGLLPKRGQLLPSIDWDAIPPAAGLYWLKSGQRNLYVGETHNLRRRLQLQLNAPAFDFWNADRRELNVRVCPMPDADDVGLKGNQSWWIRNWKPIGNYWRFVAV